MARPKSEDRRAALLDAATQVFAENGLAASTASISAKAKVSEGSFFTYFKTKDELLNELYRDLRLQLNTEILAGFPHRGSARDRLEHLFSAYVTWGVRNPMGKKALKVIGMSPALTKESLAENAEMFALIAKIKADAGKSALPQEMQSHALKAIADMTMDLIEKQPKRAEEFRAAGFQMLWGAMNAKP